MNVSRASFTLVTAPRDQPCSCNCGQRIHRGDQVYARPYTERGKARGTSRIIDLDEHYDEWLEIAAKEYAKVIRKRHPELRRYFGEDV